MWLYIKSSFILVPSKDQNLYCKSIIKRIAETLNITQLKLQYFVKVITRHCNWHSPVWKSLELDLISILYEYYAINPTVLLTKADEIRAQSGYLRR